MKNFLAAAAAGIMLLGFQPSPAQTRVMLDNYFNHETNPKTGEPFHYLWTDQANSGFSKWGDILKKKGAVLETLKEAPTAANLKKVAIYIIVDPDTTSENPSPNYILPADIKEIVGWVKKGGVLVLLGNDIGNCEFNHLNQLAENFGMVFNAVSLYHVTDHHYEMGAISPLPSHPVFKGVNKIYLKDISSFTLSGQAKPVLVDKDHNVLMAESHIGKGFVFAVGDPWIYNEYIDNHILPKDIHNYKAAENLSDYLMARTRSKKGGK